MEFDATLRLYIVSHEWYKHTRRAKKSGRDPSNYRSSYVYGCSN
jgi:hypothetical protein